MKINAISFGTTYLKPSISNLSPENREKLKYSYPIGEIYPNDIYLGGTRNGDLIVEIKRATPLDYLIVNGYIEPTSENIKAYTFVKKLERAMANVHGGNNVPVTKTVIKYLDFIPEDILAANISLEVEDYNKKYMKKFVN